MHTLLAKITDMWLLKCFRYKVEEAAAVASTKMIQPSFAFLEISSSTNE
jgi:hypothetical protein